MTKRVIKEYTVRRDEILDMARQFVARKGYEQMTIQDILDGLQIAKGTFYHYFDSKQALLEALIDRLGEEAEQRMLPVLEDENLPALQKLQYVFDSSARWKNAQKNFLLALMQVWYQDENVIVREKLRVLFVVKFGPMITTIIQQGVREGDLSPPYPDHASETLLTLLYGLGDNIARLILVDEAARPDVKEIMAKVASYNDALEHIVGAPPGSLHLMDLATVRVWFDPEENSGGASLESVVAEVGSPAPNN